MGASITTQIQILKNNQWIDFDDEVFSLYDEPTCNPFSEQNYGLFGFLADVRNDACIPVLCEPRGLPDVPEPDFGDGIAAVYNHESWHPWPRHADNHSATWFLVSELLNYNYDIEFENRRGYYGTVSEGMGEIISIRNYIGTKFFADLDILKKLGDSKNIRVVISFNN